MSKKLTMLVVLSLLAILPIVGLAVSDDGRINETAYLGGVAIYCNDAAGNITGTYEAMSHLRFLSHTGREQLRIPSDVIFPLVEQAKAGELAENTLIGEGVSRGGAVTFAVYVLQNGLLQISGTDEFGNDFEFQWEKCTVVPASPAVSSDPEPDPEAEPEPKFAEEEFFGICEGDSFECEGEFFGCEGEFCFEIGDPPPLDFG